MTDSSSHEPSSPDPSVSQEDEVRFAPKPERDEAKREKDAPRTPKKRLKTSLDVVAEHAAEENTAQQEEEIKKAKGDALFWNLCLGLFALIVIGAGYIVYEKFSHLPNPVKDTREALEASHALLLKKQEQLRDIRNRTAPKEQLLSLLDISEKTATDLEDTLKSIERRKCALPASAGKSAPITTVTARRPGPRPAAASSTF